MPIIRRSLQLRIFDTDGNVVLVKNEFEKGIGIVGDRFTNIRTIDFVIPVSFYPFTINQFQVIDASTQELLLQGFLSITSRTIYPGDKLTIYAETLNLAQLP